MYVLQVLLLQDDFSPYSQAYSNGRSEEILGKAIKKLGLPREELVIMTKVRRIVLKQPLSLSQIDAV